MLIIRELSLIFNKIEIEFHFVLLLFKIRACVNILTKYVFKF